MCTGDGGGGGAESDVTTAEEDAMATAFAQSQGVIGLGPLGLTAGQLAAEEASGVAASFSGPSPSPPGEGNIEQPVTPVVTPAVAEPTKTPTAPAIERKRRRRSLLSQEEGGLAEDGAIQRRSILGR